MHNSLHYTRAASIIHAVFLKKNSSRCLSVGVVDSYLLKMPPPHIHKSTAKKDRQGCAAELVGKVTCRFTTGLCLKVNAAFDVEMHTANLDGNDPFCKGHTTCMFSSLEEYLYHLIFFPPSATAGRVFY